MKVDMMKGFANDPRVTIIVDENPFPRETTAYQSHLNNTYVTSKNGPFVAFASIGPEQTSGMRGYAGSKHKFNLEDGTVLESTNVWSSRASYTSLVLDEPLASVSVETADGKYFGDVGMELASFIKLARENNFNVIEKAFSDGEAYYVIEKK